MSSERARRIRKIIIRVSALVLVLLVGGVLYDLYFPRTTHLREFDANEVARLEAAMWRSYYEKQRVKLFNQLSELLRTQYHMPLVRSNQVAYYAANAAFTFKKGSGRADYEKALPDLVKFYGAIRKMSDIPFDVDRVARLELEWWIIHRERARHPPGDLEKALAELQAEIYRVPVDRLMEHGRLRAEAMAIRDTKAESGRMTEEDWARISELLKQSWNSLAKAVRA
jgi:succinate dehydrogenase hydrophobic anchor subunit